MREVKLSLLPRPVSVIFIPVDIRGFYGWGGNSIHDTSNVLPVLSRDVSIVLFRSAYLLLCATVGVFNSGFGTRLNRITSGELLRPSSGLFFNPGRHHTVLGLVLVEELEHTALLHHARRRITRVYRLLENVNVPSVDKIPVQTISGWIPIGEDKWLFVVIPLLFESVGVEDDFVEHGYKLYRMCGGAFPEVNVDGVGHMGFVVWGIEVLAVPARREEDLNTEAARKNVSVMSCYHRGKVST